MPKPHRRSLVAPIASPNVQNEQQQQQQLQIHTPVIRPKKKSDLSMYINLKNFIS
jgi:hypothetical protein